MQASISATRADYSAAVGLGSPAQFIPRCIACGDAGQPQHQQMTQQQIAGGPFGVKLEHHQLPAVPPLELHGFSQSPARQRQQPLQADTAGGNGVSAVTFGQSAGIAGA